MACGCGSNKNPRSITCPQPRRILRPVVLWITPPHITSNIGPPAAPEAGEVGGYRDRPSRRRQQRELQWRAAVRQGRCCGHSIECLRPGGCDRHRLGVIDVGACAVQRQVHWQRRVQASAEVPWQQPAQDGVQVDPDQVGKSRHAAKPRREPLLHINCQCSVGEVGPARVRFEPSHQGDPCLKLANGIGPGQRPQSVGCHRAGERR